MCPAWLISTSFISEHTLELTPTTTSPWPYTVQLPTFYDVTPSSLQTPNPSLSKHMLSSIPCTPSSTPHSTVAKSSISPLPSSNSNGSSPSTRFPSLLLKSMSDSNVSYISSPTPSPSPSPSLSPSSSSSSSFLLYDSPSTLSPMQTKGLFHPVSPTDTLPGIAIKYGIQVLNLAILRQVNYLTRDTHIFAKPYLYIPASTSQPFSNSPSSEVVALPPSLMPSGPLSSVSLISPSIPLTPTPSPTTTTSVAKGSMDSSSTSTYQPPSSSSSSSSTSSPLSHRLTSIDQEIKKAKHRWNALNFTLPSSSIPVTFPTDSKEWMIELKPIFRSNFSRSSTSSTTYSLAKETK